MNTRYLIYLLTIAERKNMTKAAEELHVSQSSLSQYLSKLEQEVGTPLFVRLKGELRLTPAGRLYMDAARKILQIKDDLYEDLHVLSNSSRISVGVTSNFGLEMMAALVPAYKKEYPDINIEISETNVPTLTRLIQAEEIDCGIMALNSITPFAPEQVHVVRQEEVYFAVPVSHEYYRNHPQGTINYKDFSNYFKNEDFILGKQGSTLRYLADKLFSSVNIFPHIMCETNSISAIRSMVSTGEGVSFIGKSCATDRSKIAYYSLQPTLQRYNAFVCRKSWNIRKPEQVFIQHVEAYFDKS